MRWLLLAIIWDQLVLTVISVRFNKSKFQNFTTLYNYNYTFYCIYCLLSITLMPNLALQQVFLVREDSLSNKDPKVLTSFLNKKFVGNVITLIFSAINFKICQPFLVNIATKLYAKWKQRNKKDIKKIDPNDRNILDEMLILKAQTKKKKNMQKTKNNSLIFSLTFATNCIVCISFYGLLVPEVIFIIFPCFLSFFILDYYKFTSISEENLIQKIGQLTKNKLKKPNELDRYKRRKAIVSIPKNKLVQKLLELKKNKHTQKEKIPKTIYIHFILVLILVTFPFCIFGYYGLAKQFESYMIMNDDTFNDPEILNNINDFKFLKKTYFSNLKEMSDDTQENDGFVELMTENMRMLMLTTVESIEYLPRLKFLVLFYALYIIIYRLFYQSETFLTRIENKIWKHKINKDEEIAGESYRDMNPAYWI